MCLYNSQHVLVHPCAPVLTTRNPSLCTGQSDIDDMNAHVHRQSSWWRRARLQFCMWGRRTVFRSMGQEVVKLRKLDRGGIDRAERNPRKFGRSESVELGERIGGREQYDKRNEDKNRAERETCRGRMMGASEMTVRVVKEDQDDSVSVL